MKNHVSRVFGVFLIGFLAGGFLMSSASAAPQEGPKEVYKGIELVGTTFKDQKNKQFFKTAKLAIDMVKSLPKGKWNKSRHIRKIVYYPPSKYRPKMGAEQNAIGAYEIEDMADWPGPLVIYKDAVFSSALEFALTIVGNSGYAEEHRKYIKQAVKVDSMRKGKIAHTKAELTKEIGMAMFLKSVVEGTASKKLLFQLDCGKRAAVLQAHSYLYPDRERLSAMLTDMRDDGCVK